MLERMHNVADRDALPQKRRKVEDSRPEVGRKARISWWGEEAE